MLLALLAATAAAVPLEIPHQGRLLDADGEPLEGAHELGFALYDSAAGGVELWSAEPAPVDFDGGYFHVVLGSGTPLDSDVFDGAMVYLELEVDGEVLGDRLAIASVPYAIRAGAAASVSGGVVDASEIQVAGETVIGADGKISWDALVGVPDGADPLGEISVGCSGGDLLSWDGSDWVCVSSMFHADQIVDGTLSIDRLPVGTTGADVAKGDHTHDAAEVGAIPAGAGVPVGETEACEAGTLRFQDERLQVCDGSEWLVIAAGGQGSSPMTAATDCAALHAAHPELPTGLYWLNPAGGPASEAFSAYCDMTTSGGGWTLLASQAGLFDGDMKTWFDAAVPMPGVTAARGYWFGVDWKEAFAELRVVNAAGQTHTFATSDFTGPLVIDAENFVDAADQRWSGIMAGNAQPVLNHYQVAQVCSSADCRESIGSGPSYIHGLGIVFDWHNGDGSTSVEQHAHFGGKANIESGWARRGTLLYAR